MAENLTELTELIKRTNAQSQSIKQGLADSNLQNKISVQPAQQQKIIVNPEVNSSVNRKMAESLEDINSSIARQSQLIEGQKDSAEESNKNDELIIKSLENIYTAIVKQTDLQKESILDQKLEKGTTPKEFQSASREKEISLLENIVKSLGGGIGGGDGGGGLLAGLGLSKLFDGVKSIFGSLITTIKPLLPAIGSFALEMGKATVKWGAFLLIMEKAGELFRKMTGLPEFKDDAFNFGTAMEGIREKYHPDEAGTSRKSNRPMTPAEFEKERIPKQGGEFRIKKLAPKLQDTSSELLQKSMGISKKQYDVFRGSIAKIESRGGEYGIIGGSSNRFSGAYQMGAEEIRSSAKALGISPPSRKEFLSNPQLQERLFDKYTEMHHKVLLKNKKYAAMSKEQQLEVLGYAHNQGAGDHKGKGAGAWLRTGQAGRDANGTSGTRYSDEVRKNLYALESGKLKYDDTETPTDPTRVVGESNSTPEKLTNAAQPIALNQLREGKNFELPDNVSTTSKFRKLGGFKGIDPVLVEGIMGAAKNWKGKVEIFSGHRAKGEGEKGNHSAGRALDVRLFDEQGKEIIPKHDWTAGRGSEIKSKGAYHDPKQYESFMRDAVAWGSQYDKKFEKARWGGYFGDTHGDWMHLDTNYHKPMKRGDILHGRTNDSLRQDGGTTSRISSIDEWREARFGGKSTGETRYAKAEKEIPERIEEESEQEETTERVQTEPTTSDKKITAVRSGESDSNRKGEEISSKAQSFFNRESSNEQNLIAQKQQFLGVTPYGGYGIPQQYPQQYPNGGIFNPRGQNPLYNMQNILYGIGSAASMGQNMSRGFGRGNGMMGVYGAMSGMQGVLGAMGHSSPMMGTASRALGTVGSAIGTAASIGNMGRYGFGRGGGFAGGINAAAMGVGLLGNLFQLGRGLFPGTSNENQPQNVPNQQRIGQRLGVTPMVQERGLFDGLGEMFGFGDSKKTQALPPIQAPEGTKQKTSQTVSKIPETKKEKGFFDPVIDFFKGDSEKKTTNVPNQQRIGKKLSTEQKPQDIPQTLPDGTVNIHGITREEMNRGIGTTKTGEKDLESSTTNVPNQQRIGQRIVKEPTVEKEKGFFDPIVDFFKGDSEKKTTNVPNQQRIGQKLSVEPKIESLGIGSDAAAINKKYSMEPASSARGANLEGMSKSVQAGKEDRMTPPDAPPQNPQSPPAVGGSRGGGSSGEDSSPSGVMGINIPVRNEEPTLLTAQFGSVRVV